VTLDMASTLSALTNVLPLDQAMALLTPRSGPTAEIRLLAEQVTSSLSGFPSLRAGIWLYVDDLDRSHSISQNLSSAEGALWHAVMHRREGDFWNSKYWLRQAGDLSVLEAVYGDPFEFVDCVQKDHQNNPAQLVDFQRKEWAALYQSCYTNAVREGVE